MDKYSFTAQLEMLEKNKNIVLWITKSKLNPPGNLFFAKLTNSWATLKHTQKLQKWKQSKNKRQTNKSNKNQVIKIKISKLKTSQPQIKVASTFILYCLLISLFDIMASLNFFTYLAFGSKIIIMPLSFLIFQISQ